MTSELKACPFCGGDAEHLTQRWGAPPRNYHSVKCSRCGIWQDSRSDDAAEAAAIWNTRPPVPDKQLTDVVEALREARPFVQRHMTASNRRECALLAKIDALAALNTAPAGDDVIEVTLEMVAAGEAVFRERCGNALPENKAECEAAAIAIYGAMSRAALKATTHTEEKAGE
jgi:hypothetical protein